MNSPLVSVILPCFNSGSFIAETLSSLVNQTYSNLELIIVDDHSTDNSYDVVGEFIADYKYISIFSNPGKGSNAARVFGFQKSTGKYLLFLDSDDIVSNNYILDKVNCFQKYGDGKVVTSEYLLFENDISDNWSLNHKINKSYDSGKLMIYDMAKYWQYSQVSAWMVSRDLYIKSGGWDLSIMRNQDGELFFRILLESDGVEFCDKAVSYYRQRDGSLASKWTEKSYREFLKSVDSYAYNLLKKHNQEKDNQSIVLFYSNVLYLISWCHFDELATEIKNKIKNLGYNPIFGRSFLFTSIGKVIGFDNLCYLINKVKRK